MTCPARLSVLLAIVLHGYTPAGTQQPAPGAPCVPAFGAATLGAPGAGAGEDASDPQRGVAMTPGTPARPGTYFGNHYLIVGGNFAWKAGPHSTAAEMCATTTLWVVKSKPGDSVLRYGACQVLGGVSVPAYKIVLAP
jgi:hypothetical protein